MRGMKAILLVLLVFQNLLQVLVMRWTQTRETSERQVPSTAIFMTELIKLALVLAALTLQHGRGLPAHLVAVLRWSDTLRFAVPALCFTLQTNLLWIGIALLDAPTYMVTGQMKISLTALFAVHLLGLSLSLVQKLALGILQLGVILVQVSQMPSSSSSSSADSGSELDVTIVEYFSGIVAVIAACASSGFASVYFERALKADNSSAKPPSLFTRQLQLCLFALSFSAAGMLVFDGALVRRQGLLAGYDAFVWVAVVNSSLGGLLVAAVVKYADNVLKTFATSVSIVLSALVSLLFFQFAPTAGFAVGTLLVTTAVAMYSVPEWFQCGKSDER